MPRLPRLDLPGIAQHVVQRGVDRQPCFFTDVDRIRYLDELREIRKSKGSESFTAASFSVDSGPAARNDLHRAAQLTFDRFAESVGPAGALTPLTLVWQVGLWGNLRL